MSPIWTELYRLYVATLAVLAFAAIFRTKDDFRRLWNMALAIPPMRRTAAVLFLNWAVNSAFIVATGIYDPWFWYIPVDAVSAAAIFYQPAGRQQSVIGAIYMAQIVMHGVYASSDHHIAENNYWQVLFCLACVQLLLLGGWYVGNRGRNLSRRLRAGVVNAQGDQGV